jgi:two-component system, OmpR family, phosphate regulon sensor histidine kinase PhoR
MKKLKGITILMVITLVAIISFQGWWLKNNYSREERSLNIAANVNFQETVRRLQAQKMKWIDSNFVDSPRQGKMKVMFDEDLPGGRHPEVRMLAQEEMVQMLSAMKTKMVDSLKKMHPGNSAVVISMNAGEQLARKDTIDRRLTFDRRVKGDVIFKVLSGIDSLQDSLKISEINLAYRKSLQEDKLDVPFTIKRCDTTCYFSEEPGTPQATVGFTKPVTYQVKLGNTFPFLVKKITLPILFSILLVGITILSFMLLYRNLLRQQRLAAIKNEFISNITHELKTPIATVGVAIEALKNFNAIENPQKTREYLDISSNELQRLSLLVDKVLKLSIFEKKEIELKYEPVNLKDVVDEVVSSMKLQIEKHHAKVWVSQEGEVSLQADRLHMLSVVFNLLDNALKYSNGSPEIHVELKGDGEAKNGKSQVELSITDNGIGIPEEYRGRVFEKFFRVPTGNTHNAKGYGLGLSYVAHVVEKHKGNISVNSEKGKGTTFEITLPKNQS